MSPFRWTANMSKNAKHRPRTDGCRYRHFSDPLQGPRGHGLRRHDLKNHRHGLRLPRGQEWRCTTTASPQVNESKCIGCGVCRKHLRPRRHRPSRRTARRTSTTNKCVGCGRCIGVCPTDAIGSGCDAIRTVTCSTARWRSTPRRSCRGAPASTSRLVMDVSPNCDCHAENDVPDRPECRHVCLV